MMMIPRYFAVSVVFRSVLWSEYVNLEGRRFLDMFMTKALSSVVQHVPCHCPFGELVEVSLESMMVRI